MRFTSALRGVFFGGGSILAGIVVAILLAVFHVGYVFLWSATTVLTLLLLSIIYLTWKSRRDEVAYLGWEKAFKTPVWFKMDGLLMTTGECRGSKIFLMPEDLRIVSVSGKPLYYKLLKKSSIQTCRLKDIMTLEILTKQGEEYQIASFDCKKMLEEMRVRRYWG